MHNAVHHTTVIQFKENRCGYSEQAIACFHDYRVFRIGLTSPYGDASTAKLIAKKRKEGPWMVAMNHLGAKPSALCLNRQRSRRAYDNRSKRMPVAKFITMKISVNTTAQRGQVRRSGEQLQFKRRPLS